MFENFLHILIERSRVYTGRSGVVCIVLECERVMLENWVNCDSHFERCTSE